MYARMRRTSWSPRSYSPRSRWARAWRWLHHRLGALALDLAEAGVIGTAALILLLTAPAWLTWWAVRSWHTRRVAEWRAEPWRGPQPGEPTDRLWR